MSQKDEKRLVLIHQTDLKSAEIIIDTQQMLPGSTGLFGGGIYTANTIEAARAKAHRKGVFLVVEVYLGKTKSVSKAEVDAGKFNLAAIKQQGYTAIIGHGMKTGREIIVFDSSKVKNIKYCYGIRPKAVFRNPTETYVLFFVTSSYHAKQIHDDQRVPRIDGPFGFICYMYDSIQDALECQPAKFHETYLAADVDMINLYRLRDNETVDSPSIPQLCLTMIGVKNGKSYFMIRDRRLIRNIHYCGGKPWNE